MAREESRSRIIEDGTTAVNMSVNTDGSINVKTEGQVEAEEDKVFAVNAETDIDASERDAIYFTNPAGSGKILKVQDISFSCIDTISSEIITRIYKSPTVSSSGTGLIETPIRVGGSLPTPAAMAYEDPSVSNRGVQMFTFYVIGGPNGTSTITYSFRGKMIIDPGYSILVTGRADGTNRTLATNIVWAEIDE